MANPGSEAPDIAHSSLKNQFLCYSAYSFSYIREFAFSCIFPLDDCANKRYTVYIISPSNAAWMIFHRLVLVYYAFLRNIAQHYTTKTPACLFHKRKRPHIA